MTLAPSFPHKRDNAGILENSGNSGAASEHYCE